MRPQLRFLAPVAVLGLAVTFLIDPLQVLPERVRLDDAESEVEESYSPAVGKRAGMVPNDWFHAQRAYPGTSYDPEAVLAGMAEARADLAELGQGQRGGSPGVWEQSGPVNIGGRVTAIAGHPSSDNRIFAGIAAGGVYRSENSGVSWEAVFDDTGVLSIGAVTIDPQDASTIYVGTGEANSSGDSFAGNGIYRSTDAGDSWDHLGLDDSRHIGRIAVDPTDSDRIYVAALGSLFETGPHRGLYRSTDGGDSWELSLFVSDSSSVVDVAVDPSNPNNIYAASWERLRRPWTRKVGGLTSGIYKSTNGGNSWTLLAGGLPGPANDIGRIGLAIAPSSPQTVYAIYADDPGYFDGVYKTTNGGTSWARVNDGALSDLFSSFGWYFANIRVSPTDPNRIYAMGLEVLRSTNGGNSWSEVFNGIHVDQHALWINPNDTNEIFAGSDGGIYRSSNGGSNWTHVETLPLTQFYAGTIDPSLPERIYGGAQDNGTSRTLTGNIDDWDGIFGGDGFYCIVHPSDSDRLWVEYQWGNLYRSDDGGDDWDSSLSGVNSGDRRNWSTPFVNDPQDPETMYYGTYRLYRSTNGAVNWNSISSDLTHGGGGGSLTYGTITTIAVAATDEDRIYVGTDDARVWTTSNGGNNWTEITSGLPDRWVTRVAVDPTDDEIVYASNSGYRRDESDSHLHRSTNAGQTWTSISGGLPNAPVNVVEVDRSTPTTLYAGTDVGVYVSHDSGDSWSPLGTGMPMVVIHDLELHDATSTLVAFTHGRSTFKILLPGPSSTPGELAGANTNVPSLHGVTPNPMRNLATISFSLPSDGQGRIELIDTSGRIRRTIWDGTGNGIDRSVSFDGRDEDGRRLPAGTYFVRATDGTASDAKRIVLLPE